MKLIKSFGYAFKGLQFGFEERSIRVHLVFATAVMFLAFFFQVVAIEWVILLFCIGLVLSAELMNTALEEVCDMLTKAYPALYDKAGKPKDLGAAAVLVAAVTAAVLGTLVFLPHFVQLFGLLPLR